jgi:hypothetical protein
MPRRSRRPPQPCRLRSSFDDTHLAAARGILAVCSVPVVLLATVPPAANYGLWGLLAVPAVLLGIGLGFWWLREAFASPIELLAIVLGALAVANLWRLHLAFPAERLAAAVVAIALAVFITAREFRGRRAARGRSEW